MIYAPEPQQARKEAKDAHFESMRALTKWFTTTGEAKAKVAADYVIELVEGAAPRFSVPLRPGFLRPRSPGDNLSPAPSLRGRAGGAKLLAFAHHMTCLDAIEKAAKENKVKYVRLDGQTPSRERSEAVARFQADPEIRLAVLSMTACGQGITLTAAADVAFAELHWTPSVLLQAVRGRAGGGG